MKTMVFDSEKGRLRVNFRFEGLIAASYAFNYFEANSNDLAITPAPIGNNLNNDDDDYQLPMPSVLNKNRVILLHLSINALDVDTDYKVIIELLQENEVIDTHELTGHIKQGEMTQHPMMIVKLEC